jgi:hypothetical protein
MGVDQSCTLARSSDNARVAACSKMTSSIYYAIGEASIHELVDCFPVTRTKPLFFFSDSVF